MAEGVRFVCSECQRTIEAWSDGNPYYFDRAGKKRYAYHPDHENLARCIGNDTPHLCLECGEEFMVDSRAPVKSCPKCGSPRFVVTFELDGHPCPFCKSGEFHRDPDFFAVS
jgi:DNA-directed RNA polymerase subunit RPC12/RpoP